MFFLLWSALLLAAAPALHADIVSFPISSDFDAEFARAEDLIEAGQRAEAERVLDQIRSRADQPAWKARIEILLADADQKRGDLENAARHLAAAPAAAIGLEPYRLLRLGEVLALQGRLEDARREMTRAFETEEPFALRGQAARELARILEKSRRPADALRILSRAAALATGSEAAALGIERIRLGSSLGDRTAVSGAAHDLVAAGVDVQAPSPARRAIAQELSRATPAERARFGRARVAAGDYRRGIRLLRLDAPSRWPVEERAQNLLAIARALQRTGDPRGADRIAASVPSDGTAAAFEARLLRADLAWARVHNKKIVEPSPDDPALLAVRQAWTDLASPAVPLAMRSSAREGLIRVAAVRERFDDGIEQARLLAAESPATTAGFEPLWRLAWKSYWGGDFETARAQFADLASVYASTHARRRLSYWTARCLDRLGRAAQAVPMYRDLAASDPADLYALFARRRVEKYETHKPAATADPSIATATFRRADELLRLRFFSEASAEALALPRSRGRDRRLAEAQFALGRFPAAAAAAKRAFPEMGTATEGEVPDAWRRLYYPIEVGGFLSDRAREFGLDPAILRGLVRQESVFEAAARSRAGALGLTQLMPATARSLSRSVLRQRYRKAFLYDPKINARLGAAYFKRLLDQFGNTAFALAAYNGGPGRMSRVLRENTNRQEDEIFESHPAYETRDYVRRVLLFAESYRELYPGP